MTVEASIGGEALRYAPLLLTVVGWWYVNRQNDRREARKEHRSLIDAAKRDIGQIAGDAKRYMTERDSVLAPQIKWALEVLEIDLERIPGFARASDMMMCFVAFSEACTGGDFEVAERPVYAPDSDEVRNMLVQRNLLLKSLERWFSEKYC